MYVLSLAGRLELLLPALREGPGVLEVMLIMITIIGMDVVSSNNMISIVSMLILVVWYYYMYVMSVCAMLCLVHVIFSFVVTCADVDAFNVNSNML